MDEEPHGWYMPKPSFYTTLSIYKYMLVKFTQPPTHVTQETMGFLWQRKCEEFVPFLPRLLLPQDTQRQICLDKPAGEQVRLEASLDILKCMYHTLASWTEHDDVTSLGGESLGTGLGISLYFQSTWLLGNMITSLSTKHQHIQVIIFTLISFFIIKLLED